MAKSKALPPVTIGTIAAQLVAMEVLAVKCTQRIDPDLSRMHYENQVDELYHELISMVDSYHAQLVEHIYSLPE